MVLLLLLLVVDGGIYLSNAVFHSYIYRISIGFLRMLYVCTYCLRLHPPSIHAMPSSPMEGYLQQVECAIHHASTTGSSESS